MNSDRANNRKRVLLVGLGPTAETALEGLRTRFTVCGLIRDCAAPQADADPVIRQARQLDVPIIPTATIPAIEQALAELRPDCVVISSFSRVLPESTLAKGRFLNVHYALLPGYRGRANVNWAILNGEKQAGISIHEVAPGLDAGNIYYQAAVPIHDRDTVTDLYDRLNRIQQQALPEAVERYLSGSPGQAQDEAQATYGCTRLPDDGDIDFSQPTLAIDRLIRALTAPFPGAFTYFEGRRLVIERACPVERPPRYVGRIPGRVVRVARGEGWVDVLTGDGVLRVLEVRTQTGQSLPAAQVIRTVKASLGVRVPELLRRIELLETQLADLVKRADRAPESGSPQRAGV